MSASDIKQIQITGGAAEDFHSMKTGRKKRTSRKQRKDDGNTDTPVINARSMPRIIRQDGGTSPGTLVSLQASSAPTTPGNPEPKGIESSTGMNKPAPAYKEVSLKGGADAVKHAEHVKPEARHGDHVKPKVVLEAPAKKTAQLPKVHLGAPKSKSEHKKTRKMIKVSLTGLGKRMTRHKKIQKEAKALPLEKVKKILVEAKLLKPESKAPESMIRQIYADYQTLKNKAL